MVCLKIGEPATFRINSSPFEPSRTLKSRRTFPTPFQYWFHFPFYGKELHGIEGPPTPCPLGPTASLFSPSSIHLPQVSIGNVLSSPSSWRKKWLKRFGLRVSMAQPPAGFTGPMGTKEPSLPEVFARGRRPGRTSPTAWGIW